MIFDTHCHYNLSPLLENWTEHWAKAQSHGVTHCMVVGADLTSSQAAVEIAQHHPNLYAAIGIHPGEYQQLLENGVSSGQVLSEAETDFSQLKSFLSDAKVKAVGETGLDYFRLPSDQDLVQSIKAVQQTFFRRHILLAQAHKKVVIIHVRDQGEAAYHDVLNILKDEYHTNTGFILHCVSGPLSVIKEAVSMGGYIGVAANVTYPKADNIRSIVKIVPQDRLLLETDAPFLPPQQFRGKQCEPWMISLTAKYLEEELGVDRKQLYANAQRLFTTDL